ncbi:hypothetical protein [Cryobacterium zhongshanensis]|uniref:Uncharacterized protein n=1 Tax=Cryobacterium zhongshanensis TaxID=2928153 RepID=A0AA41QX11_9MICO|nr:hypothetical protein [Cryobacterium zhongshanensis]MCI4659710.1 hypothetical protein [Cryobacterium zhongshanensis]
MMVARPYKEVRKDYINARSSVLAKSPQGVRSWLRDAKEAACREFDEFIQEQRKLAVDEALARIEAPVGIAAITHSNT